MYIDLLDSLKPWHSLHSTDYKPLFSIKLYVGLPSLCYSNCTWSLLPPFLLQISSN